MTYFCHKITQSISNWEGKSSSHRMHVLIRTTHSCTVVYMLTGLACVDRHYVLDNENGWSLAVFKWEFVKVTQEVKGNLVQRQSIWNIMKHFAPAWQEHTTINLLMCCRRLEGLKTRPVVALHITTHTEPDNIQLLYCTYKQKLKKITLSPATRLMLWLEGTSHIHLAIAASYIMQLSCVVCGSWPVKHK